MPAKEAHNEECQVCCERANGAYWDSVVGDVGRGNRDVGRERKVNKRLQVYVLEAITPANSVHLRRRIKN